MGENSDSATITYPEEPMTHRIPPQTIGRKTNRIPHSDALNGCIASSSMDSMDVKRYKLKIESSPWKALQIGIESVVLLERTTSIHD